MGFLTELNRVAASKRSFYIEASAEIRAENTKILPPIAEIPESPHRAP